MEMVISIQELREVLSTVQLNARRIRHELRDASIRFQRIKESDVMFGRTKDAIDQVIENQHIPILRALYEAYRLLEKEVQRMLNAAREQTSEWDDTGFIREAAIDTISGRRYYGKGLSGYAAEKLEYDQEFKSIYFYLEDVLSLEMPNNYEYDEHIASLEDDLQDIRNRLRYFRFDMTPFRDLIGKINREINRLEGTVDQPFTDPERMRISGRIEFRASTQVLHAASIQARTEKIESLLIEWDGQDPAEVFANLSRPLSEAEVLAWSIFTGDVEGLSPEERMAVGRDQRNNGIIMIGGGMLLIIFTKGKATPFVAKYFQGASATTIATATSGFKLGGYSFGGGSIAFGASEVGEGLHNIELGSEGDVFSPASNFLRDNVFGGDQSLYNAFKNDVSAVTTIANLTLITIPSLKQRPAPTPPPPSNTRILSNGRTMRTTNDFAGFRGDIRSVNAPQMSYVNGQWVKIPPPSNTRTLSNGRTMRTTNDFAGFRGNIQNVNAPQMSYVNGQWVKIPPPSNTRILSNGRRLRTTNDFAGFRGNIRSVNAPQMSYVNGQWVKIPPPSNTRILSNGRRLRTTNDFSGFRGNIRNVDAPRMAKVNGQWVLQAPKYTEIEITRILNNLRGSGFANNPLRIAYENEVANLVVVKERLVSQGVPQEEIARRLHQMRLHLGVVYKDATPQPLRDFIFDLNRSRYGDPLGGSFEFFMNKYRGNYTKIIDGATRPNADINRLLSAFEEWLRSQ